MIWGVAGHKCLSAFGNGSGKKAPIVMIVLLPQREDSQPVLIRFLGSSNSPKIAAATGLSLPKIHLGPGDRRSIDDIAKIENRLVAGCSQDQRALGDQDYLAGGFCAADRLDHVRPGRERLLQLDHFVAGHISPLC